MRRHVCVAISSERASPVRLYVRSRNSSVHRGRELRRAAEAAVSRFVRAREPPVRVVEKLRVDVRGRLRAMLIVAKLGEEFPRRLPNLFGARAVGFGDGDEYAREAGHLVPVFGREVCAAVEGHEVGREEDRQGPAAVARHHLDGVHVDLVEVGALFAVNLDVDEVLVHESRDVFVLERLALHHVTPVARRVADAQEYRLVFALRARERLFAPRVPVHGVVRVLQKVRARLAREAVRVLVLGHAFSSPLRL